MIKRMKKFLSGCTWNKIFNICVFRIPIIVFIVVMLITIGKITIEKRWIEIFSYPEEEYQNLETEAKLMVDNQTFDTDYFCTIKKMDNRSDDVSFSLKSENASIDVEVTDYKKDTQIVKTKRFIGSKGENIFDKIALIFIIIPFLPAIFTAGLLGTLSLFIYGIVILFKFIINKVKE